MVANLKYIRTKNLNQLKYMKTDFQKKRNRHLLELTTRISRRVFEIKIHLYGFV